MLIEFVGLPGTGKSALAHLLGAELENYGFSTRSVNAVFMDTPPGRRRLAKRLGLAGRFALRRPLESARAAYVLARSRQRGLSELRIVVTNLLSKCQAVRQADKSDYVHISDEGLYHALWSGMYGAASTVASNAVRALADHLLNVVPAADVIVVVEAPDEVVAERLLLDPKRNRLGQAVEAEGLAALGRARDALRVVLEVISDAREIRGSHVIYLTNGADVVLQDLARHLASDIVTHMRGSRAEAG